MTPLHLACQNGHTSIVDILLDNRATGAVDVNKQDEETPFYLAAKNGHADVVEILLRHGICECVEHDFSKKPISIYAAILGHHTKVVEVILKHSCRISDKLGLTKDEKKLQGNVNKLAETRGIIQTKFIKSDDRRVNAGIVWREVDTSLQTVMESELHTALQLAVNSIQPKMVNIFLCEGRCVYSEAHLVNCFRCLIDETNENPDNWHEVITEMKDMNVMRIMEFLCYEIQYRMKCKSIKEIERLLMNSSKFNVNHQYSELQTLLHDTIQRCEECDHDYLAKKSSLRRFVIKTVNDMIQLLLEKGADFNMKNASGETPLIIASARGCSHIIETLFDWEQKSGLKLDSDARDQHGATALIKAAEKHHASVMRLLLSHKVSVNLHDYYGFTALHAAVYEENRNWFDLHFFCKRLLEHKCDYIDECREIHGRHKHSWGELTVCPFAENPWLKKNLEHNQKTPRCREEIVELLLALSELDVNAIDFKGKTPLDLAVKSSQRITLETFKALEYHGAIRNSLEPIDEAPVEMARFDERGRGPLHRLEMSKCSVQEMATAKREKECGWLNFMANEFLRKPDNFRQSANATDDKGRTPLHYAVMSPSNKPIEKQDRDLMRVLLDVGCSVNAVDMYGKTPLHYAETNEQYELLIKYGEGVESIKDKSGHTPEDLRKLRESVEIDTDYAKKLEFAKNELYRSSEIERAFEEDHVTELSMRKLVETIKIYSQSPRLEESSEEAIWKIWTHKDLFSLNRRLGKLKRSIHRFIDRLADEITKKDGRFECKPKLVGSADEETKAFISGDFDFNFKLTKLSQICDVFPHPLGPNGYFQLRRKSGNANGRQSVGDFDSFFNLDHCLLTNEVNSRFQIVLEDVLHDPCFWQDEHIFERSLTDTDANISYKPAGLCRTVSLRMINPLADGEGGFHFINVSIDVVACIHVEDSCLGNQLPVSINPTGKTDGYTLVFDRPRFDPYKPHRPYSIFSDTFSRISFAPVESRIIRESSSLTKAAYIVCKLILHDDPKTTYQLKTSLLFCMEALKIQEGCEQKDEDKFTPKELAFLVERLVFGFCEFYQYDVFPCYFMPSFKQQAITLEVRYRRLHVEDLGRSPVTNYPFYYSEAFDIYLNLCPDDAGIDIPIQSHTIWEEFDREGLIRKLEPRSKLSNNR